MKKISGDWFKNIICMKKTKQEQGSPTKDFAGEKSNGFKQKHQNEPSKTNSVDSTKIDAVIAREEIAAVRIQNAFRKYKAGRVMCLKGQKRLDILVQRNTVQKQTYTTLSYIQLWSKMQSEIRARRACMVTETRIRQKKQENQMKLEVKLHDLEVEWDGGSETTEEILCRMQQREEAAIKRERAMAYAFSHQWRATSSNGQTYDFGNGNWGWSWLERWVAARPWEARLPTQSISPSKAQREVSKEKPAKTSIPAAKRLYTAGKTKKQVQPTDDNAAKQEPKPKLSPIPNDKHKNGKVKQIDSIV